MTKTAVTETGKLRAVLIPVVIGGLLGLFASLATNAYSSWVAQKETIRKERVAQLERAMTLCARYANDVGKVIALGVMTKGDVGAQNLDVLTAPSDTLLELSVVTSLYLPTLRDDVDQLYQAHGAMMQRFDEIIDARSKHTQEDAAAFNKRIQAEVAPALANVRTIRNKIGELAQVDRHL
jgi:hypothetical protein